MGRARFLLHLAIGCLIAITLAGALRARADAHAALDRTDPPSNEVLAQSPGRIELRFTEPVEETYTQITLVDSSGSTVPDTSFGINSDDATLVWLNIPSDLERDTYSVVWRTLSAADGHRLSGYFVFTIGTTEDVRTVVAPAVDGESGPPAWLDTAGRWLSFLMLSLLGGIWVTWLFVIRPALAPAWQIGPEVTRRVRTYAWAVGFLYLVSAVLVLILQVSGQSDGSWFPALNETLTETRWGRIWTLRIIFGGAIVLLFMAAPWWWPKRHWATTIGLLALTVALPLPHALISHAAASRYGRTEALVADYAHLLAMTIWVGGLGTILAVVASARDLTAVGQRAVLARALPRFSVIALTCWVTLGLTGVYSGYLQIGSWDGLFNTAYGRSLVYKLIALVIVLAIAAFNLLIVTRRIARPAEDGGLWWRRFGALVSLELVGVLVVLVFVGRMTGMEPSRSVLGERDNQRAVTLELDGRQATLSLAPGSVGPNHIRLDIGGEPLPAEAAATLLLTPPLDLAAQKSIDLVQVSPNAYEGHSAEVSIVGDWAITVTISQIGAFQLQGETAYTAPERQPPGPSIELPAWTVTSTGVLGGLAIIAGAVALLAAWRATSRSGRREGLGLGAVALIAGLLLIVQGRADVVSAGIPLDTPNPVPLTDQAIQVGEAAYLANCIACHGVGAAGDGPAGEGMNPPPANLLEGHALFHSDAEFFNWIRNGKPGTAMPAFSEQLTDEQIWSVIHYLRALQQEQSEGAAPDAAPAGATPIP